MYKEREEINKICRWIGEGERCRHPAIFGKSYCEGHYNRIYLEMPPEMADYIINKELEK